MKHKITELYTKWPRYLSNKNARAALDSTLYARSDVTLHQSLYVFPNKNMPHLGFTYIPLCFCCYMIQYDTTRYESA